MDSKDRLISLVGTLNSIANIYDFPIIVSTHPRTKKRLEALDDTKLDERIQFLKPFGFHDYNKLQLESFCAISDSGTIAEESSILDFPAVTPRDAIERPEAMDTGNIICTGLNPDTILSSIGLVTDLEAKREKTNTLGVIPEDYQILNTSERVAKLIIGTARLSNNWDGIRMHDYI